MTFPGQKVNCTPKPLTGELKVRAAGVDRSYADTFELLNTFIHTVVLSHWTPLVENSTLTANANRLAIRDFADSWKGSQVIGFPTDYASSSSSPLAAYNSPFQRSHSAAIEITAASPDEIHLVVHEKRLFLNRFGSTKIVIKREGPLLKIDSVSRSLSD